MASQNRSQNTEPITTEAVRSQNPHPKILDITSRTQDCSHQSTDEIMDPTSTKLQFLQSCADKWACRQSLERHYDTHKGRSITAGPATELVSATTASTSFEYMQTIPITTNILELHANRGNTSQSLSYVDSLPEDLSYSLRNFVVVDPVDDPNTLFARIAVKGGLAMRPGCVPSLPEPRRFLKGEKTEVNSERGTYGGQ